MIGYWGTFYTSLTIVIALAIPLPAHAVTLEEEIAAVDTLAKADPAPATHPLLGLCRKELQHLRERTGVGSVAPKCLEQGQSFANEGDYPKAEALMDQVLRLRLAYSPNDKMALAEVYNEQGILMDLKLDYRLSDEKHTQALAIREQSLLAHPELVFESLHNRASNRIEMNDYESAAQDLQRAKEIYANVLKADNPSISILDKAVMLNTVGIMHRRLGAVTLAIADYREAQDNFQTFQSQNPKSPKRAIIGSNLAIISNDLALAYQDIARDDPEKLQEAEALFGKSEKIFHEYRINNPDHLSVLYNNRAVLRQQLSVFAKSADQRHQYLVQAEADFKLALSLTEQAFSSGEAPSHPAPRICRSLQAGGKPLAKPLAIVDLISNYGEFLRLQGNSEEAYRWQLCALETRTALGEDHLNLAESRFRMADLELARGHLETALAMMKRAATGQDHQLGKLRLITTESGMTQFLDTLEHDAARIYSLVPAHLHDPELLRLALRTALLRKNLSAEHAADLFHSLIGSAQKKDQELLLQLRRLSRSLADRIIGQFKNAPDSPGKISEIQRDMNAIEQDLVNRGIRLAPPLDEKEGDKDIVGRVTGALPPGHALLEVVSYRVSSYDVQPTPAAEQRQYLGLLLAPDGTVSAANLGSRDKMHEALEQFLAAVAVPPAEGCNAARPGPVLGAKATGPALRELLTVPLRQLFGSYRHVYLALDDELNVLPFAALHDGADDWLHRYRFTYLNSGRDLLRSQVQPALPVRVVALVDPLPQRSKGEPQELQEPPLRGADSPCSEDLRLQGARIEGMNLKQRVPSTLLLMDQAASKNALLSLQSPGILHIGSHAFLSGQGEQSCWTRALNVKLPSDGLTNPLLRSGLLLTADDDQKNGFVTSLEISRMNLQGTQIANIAGCRSGLGEIHPGHGVYGLRRAFFIAGAQTMISSLWDVSDKSTKNLMLSFYEKLLSGQDRVEALHGAAEEVQKKCAHPYYWAPFVISGMGGVLQGLDTITTPLWRRLAPWLALILLLGLAALLVPRWLNRRGT